MATPELRRVTDDEWVEYCRWWSANFHEEHDDEEARLWRDSLPPQRCWTATDEVGHLASSGAMPFRISVPGGDTLGCAGVTVVGVRVDHRRRGLLRAMMTRLHEDALANDEPVAALYASESAIYGRFGYGLAVPLDQVTIRSQDLATIRGGDASRVRLITRERWLDLAPRLADAMGRVRAGMLTLPDGAWEASLHTADKHPHRFAAVGERGVVHYRTKDGPWEHRVPDATLDVRSMFAVDAAAEADLWAHLAAVDLVTEITAKHVRVDHPLRFMVADEARVRDRSSMPMWVRLLDMPRALATRSWEVADRLVLAVTDRSMPANAGTWSLDAGPDGCEVTRTDESADAALDVADLASLWLGGVPPATLAAAGRLEVAAPEVVGRLRRLFAVDVAPWTPFDF